MCQNPHQDNLFFFLTLTSPVEHRFPHMLVWNILYLSSSNSWNEYWYSRPWWDELLWFLNRIQQTRSIQWMLCKSSNQNLSFSLSSNLTCIWAGKFFKIHHYLCLDASLFTLVKCVLKSSWSVLKSSWSKDQRVCRLAAITLDNRFNLYRLVSSFAAPRVECYV